MLKELSLHTFTFALLISVFVPGNLFPQFTTHEPLPGIGTIWGHSAALLGDTIYIAGGSIDGTPSRYFAKYSISSGEWKYSEELPAPRSGGDMAVCGKRIYYLGGGSKSIDAADKEVFVYDPANGLWKYETDIPVPVSGNSAECFNDSLIYSFFGGWKFSENVIQVYNTNSRKWFYANPIPGGTGRRSFACGIDGNTIFICGGYSGGFRNDLWTGKIDISFPEKIIWSMKPSLAVNTSRPGGTAIGGKFIVVPGEMPGGVVTDTVAVWSVVNDQWTYIDGKPTGISNLNNCVISRNVDSDEGYLTQVWFTGGSFRGVSSRPMESLVINGGNTKEVQQLKTSSTIPNRFELYQNYPNPFNPATIIKFDIPFDSYVRIGIYDILGKLISLPVLGNYRSGTYDIRLEATNLPGGCYFCKFSAGSFEKTTKMVLIK